MNSSEQELTEEVTATAALEEDMSGELIMDHDSIKKERHGKQNHWYKRQDSKVYVTVECRLGLIFQNLWMTPQIRVVHQC